MKRTLTLIFLLTVVAFAVAAAPTQPRRALSPIDTLRIADVSDAQISPDGQWVIYVVSHNEGNEKRASLWLARTIFFAGTSTVNQAERARLALLGGPPELPRQFLSPGWDASRPRWSPDSKRLAFLGTRDSGTSGSQSGLWVVSLADRQPRFVTGIRETNFHIPYAGESIAWSPDGRRIAFISASEEIQEGTLRASDQKRDDPRVIDRIQYKSRTSFSDRARTHVWVIDLDDPAAPRQLTAGLYYDHALTWNPRGDEIAFLSNREHDPEAINNSDIYTVGLDGRVRRVTETRGCEYEPVWSPDGRWIAHTATTREVTTIDSVAEDAHVWLVEASGGARREITAALDRRARAPRWSPDSRHVFFLAGDRGRTLIYRVGVDGGISRPFFDRFDPLTYPNADQLTLPARPYQMINFSVSTRSAPAFAFTLSDPIHPAEVWIGDASGDRAQRASAHNDALLRHAALVEPEEISFKSFDGTSIQGWLMKPVGLTIADSRRFPLVLSVHGGPHGMYGYGFNATFQAYAGQGYGVLYLNPRGSSGYGQKFSDGTLREWGGGDYRDLMLGLDAALRAHSWIDADRLGITGGSYGGFMTNWAITQTTRFRAAVASASVSNLISFYGTSLYQDLIHAEFGGFPWDDYDLLWRWSPLRYVRAVETPTLFIHGEQDHDVPITQAEEMYMALKRRGIDTLFVRYPREGHGLREPRHRLDALERTLAWFDKFLK